MSAQQLTQQQQIALERLDTLARDLRSRQDEIRRKAAIGLRDLVVVCHRDLTAEHFHLFYTGVNNRITQLITHGNDSAERIGGIYALDALIDFEAVDAAVKYTRFTQNLKTILRGKDINPMQAAAIALGKLCRPGGTLTSELVEAEVKTALEWLQSERIEERRYSAVLTLRELARNAPTLMYAYVGLVFDLIWVGLRDTRQLIRATASETVSACFRIIRERDQELKHNWMTKMYNETNQGLKVGTIESVHGSLLVLKELLEQGGMFMQDHYDEACEIVFKHKDHRDQTIRKTVILLVPDLASYSPADFANRYLHKFMLYLSGMLKKDKERNDAFLAIGNIANSVKSAIAPYLDGVLIYVREGLSIASRKRGSVDPVFDCISRLAVAVGQTLSKYMEALLDPIFACELTPKLTQALVDMAFYIPPVKATIQNRLLDMLSIVLCGEPFKPLGAPQPNTLNSVPIVARDAKDPQAYEHRKAEIKLALNTLGSFDFSGTLVLQPLTLSQSAKWRLKCIASPLPSTAARSVRSRSLDWPMESNRFVVDSALLNRRQEKSPWTIPPLAPIKTLVQRRSITSLTTMAAFSATNPSRDAEPKKNKNKKKKREKEQGPESILPPPPPFGYSDTTHPLVSKFRRCVSSLNLPLTASIPESPGESSPDVDSRAGGSGNTTRRSRAGSHPGARSPSRSDAFRLIKCSPPETPPVQDRPPSIANEETGQEEQDETDEEVLTYYYYEGHVLNEFVRDVAIKYVEDEDPEIREAAALTCCQLYVRDPIVNQTSCHALQVVGDVIEKLLTVGVSDPEPKIRRTVLAALDERFDRHLAKAENIRVLFFALNDEIFAIREVAISIIGRLARFNPAYVVPSLRKSLIQMLTELEFSDVARNKEESARLLSLLIQNAQGLIKPYVTPMISVLLPKANDPTPSVAATILNAIGELATVGGEDMLPYKDDLMPIIIGALQDQSSNAKREAALHALGQLASSSGYVITPYIEYPQLLELLQQIIRSEGQQGPLRQETIKLMGILGALDPYKHQVFDRLAQFRRYPPVWALNFQDRILHIDPKAPDSEDGDDGCPDYCFIHEDDACCNSILQNKFVTCPSVKQVEERTPEIQRRVESNQMTDISLMMTGLTPSNKEYFPTVVINALLQILKDQSLVQHHAAVIEAIMNIFRTLGLECVSFLDRIVPAFLQVIRSSPTPRLESYFNQLATLVTIVRQHIRNYLPAIVDILREYWSTSTSLQTTILHLVEAISQSLEGEFKVYLAGLLPLMLGALERDVTARRTPSERVLHAFLVFGSSSEEYMHLIIPVIVRTFEKQGQPIYIRKLAIETIGKISLEVNLNDFAARIIHPLSRVLAGTESSLRMAALDTLCHLIGQLGKDYVPFMANVNKMMAAHGVQHSNYELLVSKLQKGESLPQHLTSSSLAQAGGRGGAGGVGGDLADEPAFGDLGTKKLEMNPVHLKAAWDTKGKSTKEDWQEWLRRFSTTLLTESPNHALRACASLASVYLPLARELFNSAFVSCWSELYEQFQDELIQNIESAIKSENVPPDLLGLLLNLAEFMEHDDKALPIDIRVLGREAARCHAYAKALHYKELEFLQDQSSPAVEALIVINNQLQQSDAAIGILRKAQAYKDGITLRETWFERLERWEEALEFYNKRIEEAAERDEKPKVDVLMGRMRCLHALGEWDMLASIANDTWQQAPQDLQRLIAPLATAAAWGLGKWDSMDNYLQSMRRHTPDRSFFSAILALHRNQFRESLNHVQQAREALDTELSALISESYNRAYQVVVRVQMLAELEELIVYKQCDEKRQATMRRTWETRLKGCQRNVEVWQRMLRLRALVITPAENMHMWIKFANLCRKSGRMSLAEKSLQQLVGIDGSLDEVLPYWGDRQQPLHNRNIPAQVVYAVLKFTWEKGVQVGGGAGASASMPVSVTAPGPTSSAVAVATALAAAALKQKDPDRLAVKSLYCLRKFTNDSAARLEGIKNQLAAQVPTGFEISSDFNFQHPLDPSVLSPQTHKALQEQTVLLAKCYLRQGEWLKAIHQDDWKQRHVEDVLQAYSCATKYNPNWYRAWHGWALANFEIINDIMNRAMNQGQDLSAEEQAIVIEHVVPAVRGFFKSIALSVGSSLQDTLRLLTLWFAHGGHAEVNGAVTEGFGNVSVDTWLEVIPQLIARINQPNRRVQATVHALLSDVGRAHPQALVYPLTVAMKSWKNTRRSRSAAQIMESMRQHSHALVNQADVVSHELIRVAVLWHELWHEGLEEASRLYFGDHNIEGMFAALGPLHEMLERGPETLREISFAQAFGRDLSEAREWCRQYETSRDVNDLNQAWDLYYQVFRRISRQLPQMTTLELTYCSPKLLAAKDLDLAVPGTYRSGQDVVRIRNFDSTFSVINSKQRPRKLSVLGSDGTSYTFLLKGHEDIRQDERVMQLFGLCNTLLAHDTECYKRHLGIQRYPAIPLSQNSGLLGWVPNSDTLHVLIREYRESRKILLNIEHRIMLQMAPDYDNLTLMQKVEVFGYALDNTTGQDLYRVLWLKSKSSEAWLERRTSYTRSLGVMSMVGYILGLGDRHPSNLMLDRITGKIIHIDFGDCFEVAMKREKYPERVPFRLTRMLTYAMEVSNIEGSFRITCEHVMRVLRDNKESVMAVLEAFIHDPLLTWRLTNTQSPAGPFQSEREAAIGGGGPGGVGVGNGQPVGRGGRRPSIMEGNPQEFLAAMDNTALGGGVVPPGSTRARARTNSSAHHPNNNNLDGAGGSVLNGNGAGQQQHQQMDPAEAQNARAIEVLARVNQKLTGRDFKTTEPLDVVDQVDKLIHEATKFENLCQHYIGWCSFW